VDLQPIFLEKGVLTAFRKWLEPLPDGSLPTFNIRRDLLTLLGKVCPPPPPSSLNNQSYLFSDAHPNGSLEAERIGQSGHVFVEVPQGDTREQEDGACPDTGVEQRYLLTDHRLPKPRRFGREERQTTTCTVSHIYPTEATKD